MIGLNFIYPYDNLKKSTLTDKFSCYSYISIFYPMLAQSNLYNILRIGAVIENSLYELNHMIQYILYFNGNNKTLFNSPNKDYDEGENFEVLLFGRKIYNLRSFECFYIFNEQNYSQTLKDFRANFEKLYDITED